MSDSFHPVAKLGSSGGEGERGRGGEGGGGREGGRGRRVWREVICWKGGNV